MVASATTAVVVALGPVVVGPCPEQVPTGVTGIKKEAAGRVLLGLLVDAELGLGNGS